MNVYIVEPNYQWSGGCAIVYAKSRKQAQKLWDDKEKDSCKKWSIKNGDFILSLLRNVKANVKKAKIAEDKMYIE